MSRMSECLPMPVENVRPKRRWWLYGLVAGVLVGGGLATALLLSRATTKQRIASVEQLLAIVDQDYQRCALGEVPAPSALGHTELLARVSGKLTPARSRSCGEIVKNKLEPLRHLERDDNKLASFFLPVVVRDGLMTSVGICEHVRSQRTWANELGANVVVPDCSLKLPELEPAVITGERDLYTTHLRDHVLVLDVWKRESHMLRGTYDGQAWEESPAIHVVGDLHVAGNAGNTGGPAFGFTFANDKENARYVVYDGEEWHVGAFVVGGGGIEMFRRTSAGWTIVTSDETPTVVRLTPMMDKVVERVPIKALAGRWGGWGDGVGREAIIDKAGNVTAVRVAQNGDHVEVESHFVPVGGKAEPAVITKLDGHPASLSTSHCLSGTTAFMMIGGFATLLTKDRGKSFTPIPGGNLTDDEQHVCTAGHLYIASKRQFTACDHERCITQAMPVPPNQDIGLDVEMIGEEPKVLVTIDDHNIAFLLAPHADTGELQPVSVWRWHNPMVVDHPPPVRIYDVWFAPRKPSIY